MQTHYGSIVGQLVSWIQEEAFILSICLKKVLVEAFI